MLQEARRFRILLVIGLIFLSIVPIQILLGITSVVAPLTRLSASDGALALVVIFAVTLVEALFVLSLYFPGTVILIGIMIASTEKGPVDLLAASLTAAAGAVSGSLVNYHATYYYDPHVRKLGHRSILDLSQKLLERFGRYTSLLLSAHPNYLGALYALFGVLKLPLGIMPLTNVASVAFFVFGYFWLVRLTGISTSEDSINALYIGSFFLVLFVLTVLASLARRRYALRR